MYSCTHSLGTKISNLCISIKNIKDGGRIAHKISVTEGILSRKQRVLFYINHNSSLPRSPAGLGSDVSVQLMLITVSQNFHLYFSVISPLRVPTSPPLFPQRAGYLNLFALLLSVWARSREQEIRLIFILIFATTSHSTLRERSKLIFKLFDATI